MPPAIVVITSTFENGDYLIAALKYSEASEILIFCFFHLSRWLCPNSTYSILLWIAAQLVGLVACCGFVVGPTTDPQQN